MNVLRRILTLFSQSTPYPRLSATFDPSQEMRRPPTQLAVDTTGAHHDEFVKATQSPSTAHSHSLEKAHVITPIDRNSIITLTTPPYEPPSPSIRLLFSNCTRRDVFTLLVPAILVSLVAGGVAPFMTYVIGRIFDVFALYPFATASHTDKTKLVHDISILAAELVALAFGALVLGGVMSTLWVCVGERNVMRIRQQVYLAVTTRELEWFDINSPESGAAGAGGMMAAFTRDTDEVRKATSFNTGMLIQYIVTFITCLILALSRSWSLTLVILSAIPALVFVQLLSQTFSTPQYRNERSGVTDASTRIDRAISSIATVKAFNAVKQESSAVNTILEMAKSSFTKCTAIWGLSSGTQQFILFAMFVQGFWFGARLVRNGTLTPGDVMGVFWACLIASSNLQMCVPLLIELVGGKVAMVSLATLINPPPPTIEKMVSSDLTLPVVTPFSPSFHALPHAQVIPMAKITPAKCHGGFNLYNVRFSYPSRPTVPILNISEIDLAANETTFIVGGSGSGKSTIAQLLMGMYKPSSGTILLDDQEVHVIDSDYLRSHVALISQGCILFDMTVHENVAIGLAGAGKGKKTPEQVSREEVIKACRTALMHEFINDLPDGYDTKLGTGGANLSGGQKQRLAIARALIRNPEVLILDEATSALDATSRVLVFEAIKASRRNLTTIVITHDLSQITAEDFVYVMKAGSVVEQGYRYALEGRNGGEFAHMLEKQTLTGGFPIKAFTDSQAELIEEILVQTVPEKSRKHESVRQTTPNTWMLDAVNDLLQKDEADARDIDANRYSRRGSLNVEELQGVRSRSSLELPRRTRTISTRRNSLDFEPTSPKQGIVVEDDEEFEMEKATMKASGTHASKRRFARMEVPRTAVPFTPITPNNNDPVISIPTHTPELTPSVFQILRRYYPTIPHKPILFLGIFVCIVNGAMTPVFSFLLSRLMNEVGSGAHNASHITRYALLLLGASMLDGLALGLKFFIMENVGYRWILHLRKKCYATILKQDKSWFDESAHSSEKVVQVLMKDGEDTQLLVSRIIGQFTIVVTMLGAGLLWALVRGWQLTLVGFALGPVFAILLTAHTKVSGKFEHRNKVAREEVSRQYYEAISNVRGIRSMALQPVFQQQFDKAVNSALDTGVRGGFVAGLGYGVTNALIYLAQALLFYVGAILMSRGTYSYLRLLEVLNLVTFSVVLSSQLLGFVPKIATATQAAADFEKIKDLTLDTAESKGTSRFPITGDITFENIHFSYPQRADVPVLRGVTCEIYEGECVAVVGASGSGKSTVAALLQRLYEPNAGSIKIGRFSLADADTVWLRHHLAVVSQHAALFDATVMENICYGIGHTVPFYEVERAAREANVHDFIMSLPKGYDTMLGEKASLISGGQAQRLQIARALVNGNANILIFDECTSALDTSNQSAVINTIMKVKEGRTAIIVTHKMPVMQRCDRILVVDEGAVVEEGSYESLMERRGTFYTLANAGEWNGE